MTDSIKNYIQIDDKYLTVNDDTSLSEITKNHAETLPGKQVKMTVESVEDGKIKSVSINVI